MSESPSIPNGLNKFEAHEGSAENDPTVGIMQAWSDFSANRANNLDKIRAVLEEHYSPLASRERRAAGISNSAFYESKLQEVAPELINSMNSLRSALDKVDGLEIKWRHWERGEVIDERMMHEINTPVARAPDQYHENHGWVAGSRVGFDTVTLDCAAIIEISSEPNRDRGVGFYMQEMFAIDFRPPDNH